MYILYVLSNLGFLCGHIVSWLLFLNLLMEITL